MMPRENDGSLRIRDDSSLRRNAARRLALLRAETGLCPSEKKKNYRHWKFRARDMKNEHASSYAMTHRYAAMPQEDYGTGLRRIS